MSRMLSPGDKAWRRQEGCRFGEPLVSVGLTQQAVFQVDDAMLMFDKTTNRHRGECGPSPLPGWAGGGVGLWSARGLQVTAALSCCLLTSYPCGSKSSPGPGLTEGFCPPLSCTGNFANCRHTPGAEDTRQYPVPRFGQCLLLAWDCLVPSNQSKAILPLGQVDSSASGSLLHHCPLP